jgi:excisionase family DNA binding protein
MNSCTQDIVLPDLEERLVSIDEAAYILGLSRASIYRAIREAMLHPYRVRGRWRFDAAQIRSFVAGGGRPPHE